ncbi:DUF4233 domain-containing protein, partial [Kitasatospora sp. NPDC001574]
MNTIPAVSSLPRHAAPPYPAAVPARLAKTFVEVRPAYLAPATGRGAAMALCVLLCGMNNRPGAVAVGWALQFVLIA